MTFDTAIRPIPPKFTFSDDGHSYVVSWKWFRWTHIFMLFFCLFWFGFLSSWYAIALQGGSDGSPIQKGMLIFPVLHVAVGFFILYATVTGFFNRTEITLEPGFMTVKHRPLPWPGSRRIPSHEIKQLYVKQHVVKTKHGYRVVYKLYYMDNTDRSRMIAKDLSEEENQYLEFAIEKKLGIKNTPVSGEHISAINKSNSHPTA